MNLLDFIPKGKENAVSRSELAIKTGLDDRTIRNEIKRLVKRGVPILSSSHTRGYWLSDNLDEIESYIKETDNRRKSLYFTTLALRKEFYRRKGIKVTVVKEHIRRNSVQKPCKLNSSNDVSEQIEFDDEAFF